MKMPFIARTHAAIAALSVAGLLAGVAAPVAAQEFDDNYVGCLTPGGTITRVDPGMPLGGTCPTNHMEITVGGSGGGSGFFDVFYREVEGAPEEASVDAFCEDEEILIRGGGIVNRVDGSLLGSYPAEDDGVWRVVGGGNFDDDPNNGDTLIAYAICLALQ